MTKQRLTVVALALAMAAVGGCGAGPSDEDRIADTVGQIQDDLRAGKLSAVCARMTARPAREIGSIGHDTQPTTCPQDLAEMLRQLEHPAISEDRWTPRDAARPAVSRVSIDPAGGVATVAMSLGGDTFDVRMRERGGAWKLDDFFGALGPPPKAFR